MILNIDLNKIVNMLFEPLGKFAGDSLLGALIPVFFIVLLWVAGIHGVLCYGCRFPTDLVLAFRSKHRC